MGICFSKDGGPHEDIKMRAGERLKAFGVVKVVFNISSVSLSLKKTLYGRVLVQMMTYGAGTGVLA